MLWCVLAGAAAVALGPSTVAAAQPEQAEAAINTQNIGDLKFRYGGKKASDLPPFTKLRVGDVIELPEAGGVSLVFYASGRIERWTGPGAVTIGETEASSDTAQVVVENSDPTLGDAMLNVPVILKRAEAGRGGHSVVRGPDKQAAPLNEEESAQLASAKARYTQLRAQWPEGDVLPELYLASVYIDLGRQPDSIAVLEDAVKRCPDCAPARQMLDWLEEL